MRYSKVIIRQLLPVFITFLILFEMAAYVSTVPRPSEKFMQVYVLGSNGTAGNYYPGDSPSLSLNESINWHVGLVNNMGSVQFAAIRVKLGGNLTTDSPNDTLALPSPAPLITQFEQFLSDNGTWNLSFQWHLANFTTTTDGHLRSIELTINNSTYTLQNAPSCIASTCNLRLIFEVWTWNTNASDFQFGWWDGTRQEVAWLQLWFTLAKGGIR